jgi:hypothetical protein
MAYIESHKIYCCLLDILILYNATVPVAVVIFIGV